MKSERSPLYKKFVKNVPIKKVNEESSNEDPRIKSVQLAGARLAIRIVGQAKMSTSLEEIGKLSVAQSTISAAMAIAFSDPTKANRLVSMARSLMNGNVDDDKKVEY